MRLRRGRNGGALAPSSNLGNSYRYIQESCDKEMRLALKERRPICLRLSFKTGVIW
jgi:hypothetical protein